MFSSSSFKFVESSKSSKSSSNTGQKPSKTYQALANIISPAKKSGKPPAAVADMTAQQQQLDSIEESPPTAAPVKYNIQKISQLIMVGISVLCFLNGILLIRQGRFAPFLLGLATCIIAIAIACAETIENFKPIITANLPFWYESVVGRSSCLIFLSLVSLNQPTFHFGRLLSLFQLFGGLAWSVLLAVSGLGIPSPLWLLDYPPFFHSTNERDHSEESDFYVSEKY